MNLFGGLGKKPLSGVRQPAYLSGQQYALTLGAKTMPLQVYYYLYQGNWFDTAVAATLMTLPVLVLSAFLQRYLRETSLAGVMR
jgi:ABC-type glycerol-3-phosphate transport system permease component